MRIKIIAGTALLLSFTFAAGRVRAQGTKLITITATAEMQGTSNINVNFTIIAAPTMRAIGTKQILTFLAQDEFANGNYAAPSFPAGAKLVVTGANNDDYQVLDKSNNLLVDVTNIISFKYPVLSTNLPAGNIIISSGKMNNSTSLYAMTSTARYVLRFNYDDSAIGGGVGLTFFLQGLTKRTVTDTAPNAVGAYTQTILNEMPVAMGTGIYQGTPFVITGSQTIAGKVALNLNP